MNSSLDALTLIGTVLGLAASAGLNLYLTLLILGLSIRMGWLVGFPPELAFFAHDWVLGAVGALYVVEFFADKVPWVDSVWDTVHTVIRPLGSMYLAMRGFGIADPAVDVLAGLAAGTVTLSTHSAKASTRLIANHSPEPFSNIALSLAEDAAVAFFSWLTLHHPVIALFAVGIFLVGFAFIAPKAFRMLRAEITFVVSTIRSWFGTPASALIQPHEPALASIRPRLARELARVLPAEDRVIFAVPCFSARMPSVGRLVAGVVVGTRSGAVWFVGARTLRTVSKSLPLQGQRVQHRPRFLVDDIEIHSGSKDGTIVLRFDKLQSRLVQELVSHFATLSGGAAQPPATAHARGMAGERLSPEL